MGLFSKKSENAAGYHHDSPLEVRDPAEAGRFAEAEALCRGCGTKGGGEVIGHGTFGRVSTSGVLQSMTAHGWVCKTCGRLNVAYTTYPYLLAMLGRLTQGGTSTALFEPPGRWKLLTASGGDPNRWITAELAQAMGRTEQDEVAAHVRALRAKVAVMLEGSDDAACGATILELVEALRAQDEPAMSIALSLNIAAIRLQPSRSYREVSAIWADSVDAAEQEGDQKQLMQNLFDYGTYCQMKEKWGDSLPVFDRCIHVAEEMGNELQQAKASNNKGWSLQHIGRDAEALPLYRNAHRLFDKLGKRDLAELAMGNIVRLER